MAKLTGLTHGGTTWFPEFVQSIDYSKCTGCGRCLEVCGRNVLELKALNEDGEDEGKIERKVMIIANLDDCIGCKACSRICPQKCFTHATYAIN